MEVKMFASSLKTEAIEIFKEAVAAVLPDKAVRRALAGREKPSGRRLLVAVGKAAWQMAASASDALGQEVDGGVVITKYGHARGEIPGVRIFEAGHPIPDENTYIATEAALELTSALLPGDEVIFLVSGGGSALFEKPGEGISGEDVARLSKELLESGASINEINTLRKRFSRVKGGRFAAHCAPARIFQIVLSDVLGDRLDSIASGPACEDASGPEEAAAVAARYKLRLPPHMRPFLEIGTPKKVRNVETAITGSVRELCRAAAEACERRGYKPYLLTTTLDCEARDAGRFVASLARELHAGTSAFKPPCAVILGGETVVRLRGAGRGGRNQELALAAAEGIRGLPNIAVLSGGSDGTDGPTDAAGGVADGSTWDEIVRTGADPAKLLEENDSYSALGSVGSLIVTGPTGTNVNDIMLLLVR